MDLLINFLQGIANIIEVISFVFVFMRKDFIRMRSRKFIFLIAVIVVELVIEITSNEYFMFFVFTTIFLQIFFAFSVTFKEAIKIFLVELPMVSILEFVPYVIIGLNSDIEANIRNLISAVVIIVFIWVFYFLIGRKLQKDLFNLSGKSWVLISIESFIIFGLIYLYPNSMNEVLKSGESTLQAVLLAIGAIVITVINLFVIYSVNIKQRYKTESDYLKELNEQQKYYFELLLRKEEETKKYRHDVINEIVQMEAFIENGEYDELKIFLGDMHREITNISNQNYSVGNEVVDTMLNYYLVPLKDRCVIKVKGFADEMTKLSKRDLCIIISNLVKNAKEAVERVKEAERFINININQGYSNFSLSIENSMQRADMNTNHVIKDKQNHGIGLKNVQEIIKKYAGSYNVYNDGKVYRIEIRMPI